MKKKVKKRTLVFLAILTMLVAIVTALSIFTPVFGEVAGGGGGNTYYEERCIDVSQYKAQGYAFSKYDSHGCEIVVKSVYSGTSMKYEGQECACYKGCSGGSSNCLKFGAGWQLIACDGTEAICGLYIPQYKGGFERVENTCQFLPNQLLAGESFTGGKSITKNNLRYPVAGFCKAHPAIITDNGLKQSITSTNVYDDLQAGKSVAIASGNTLTVFYIINNNANLPTKCDSSKNLALDLNNTNVCISTLGFTYLCSEGAFDALTGTCVVQGDVRCEKGRYDEQNNVCIYNPPIQADCGKALYDVDTNTCRGTPNELYQCPTDMEFSEPQNLAECSVREGIWNECPQCPKDQICSKEICVPKCSEGQVCVWKNPLMASCTNISATYGTCIINGTTWDICGEGMEFNTITRDCELPAEKILNCDDGSTPVRNLITQKYECIAPSPTFYGCENGEVYDLTQKKCVGKISVYDSTTGEFITYQQIDADCKSDSDCSSYGDNLVCNEDNGICYSNLFPNTVFVNNADEGGFGWLSITGFIVLGILILLMLIVALL